MTAQKKRYVLVGTMRIGSRMAAASVTEIVSAKIGVAIAPTPPPKPAFEMPINNIAKTAVTQNKVG